MDMNVILAIFFILIVVGSVIRHNGQSENHLPEPPKPPTSEFIAPPYAITGTTVAVYTIVPPGQDKPIIEITGALKDES
jgi:hypothetical protein